MPRGHLIVEKNSPMARGTWPMGGSCKRWLCISRPCTQATATDPQVVFEWTDTFDPGVSQVPQIVILFDIVEYGQPPLLSKLDLEHLEGWCTWLHYGGDVELAKLASDWEEHRHNRSLTPAQKVRIESSMGFPLPTGDNIDADWSFSWRYFKRCVSQAAPFDTLWSAIERSRTAFEIVYQQSLGQSFDQIVAASIVQLRADDIVAPGLYEISQKILSKAPSQREAHAALWQAPIAICCRISPLENGNRVRLLANKLAETLEAAQKVAKV